MQVHFFDIEWDTDGEDVDLPSECTLTVPQTLCLDLNVDGADLLSDKYGFCVFSFNFEVVN